MTVLLFVVGVVLLILAAAWLIFLSPTPRVDRARRVEDVLAAADPTPELPDDDVEDYDRAHGGGW
ncbi:MAG: hypothetical protein AB7H92_15615 [Microbacteriaceae bacterium]